MKTLAFNQTATLPDGKRIVCIGRRAGREQDMVVQVVEENKRVVVRYLCTEHQKLYNVIFDARCPECEE